MHDLQEFSGLKLNFSHVFRHLSFGDDYPGQLNPLDGTVVTSAEQSMACNRLSQLVISCRVIAARLFCAYAIIVFCCCRNYNVSVFCESCADHVRERGGSGAVHQPVLRH